jgi:hypothetical protein
MIDPIYDLHKHDDSDNTLTWGTSRIFERPMYKEEKKGENISKTPGETGSRPLAPFWHDAKENVFGKMDQIEKLTRY